MKGLNLGSDMFLTITLIAIIVIAVIVLFIIKNSIKKLRDSLGQLESDLKRPKKKKKKVEDDEESGGKRHIDNCKPGDILAEDLLRSADGKRLLQKGSQLTEGKIQKLKKWNVKYVKIEMD